MSAGSQFSCSCPELLQAGVQAHLHNNECSLLWGAGRALRKLLDPVKLQQQAHQQVHNMLAAVLTCTMFRAACWGALASPLGSS